jgi:hypothetical protein
MEKLEDWKERQREIAREYYQRHRDEILERRKIAYRQKNPEIKKRGPKPKEHKTEEQ